MTTFSTLNRFLRDSASYLGVAISRTRWFALVMRARRALAPAREGGGKLPAPRVLALPAANRSER